MLFRSVARRVTAFGFDSAAAFRTYSVGALNCALIIIYKILVTY